MFVHSADEAHKAAQDLNYPLVVKALGVAHKTDVGAVKLNLKTVNEVVQAISGMEHLSQRYLIEEMVVDAVAEIIVGVVRDEQFGSYLVIGAGGILVELMRDSRSLLLPVNRQEVVDALQSLRSAALLDGFRGREKADFDAAVDTILAITDFAHECGDEIEELDINPLMIRPAGKGAVAADALLRLMK